MSRALLVCALFVFTTCQQAGAPELVLTATPKEIVNSGEETELKVLALDGLGKIGAGRVRVRSAAGSLSDGLELKIDEFGTAVVPFKCVVADDSKCHDLILVVAEWDWQGQTATASVRVKVIPPPPPPWEKSVVWDAQARETSCSGATMAAPLTCTGTCPRGFSCVEGQCLLNGGTGGLQYTLRFSQPADVDLHVIQPGTDGGCEIFWGARAPRACGATASLDLDSNASCVLDNIGIENIIFPMDRPAAGTYLARVDFWSACAVMDPVTWELEVRAGAMSRFYCGSFQRSEADRGAAGSGLTISTIVVPPAP